MGAWQVQPLNVLGATKPFHLTSILLLIATPVSLERLGGALLLFGCFTGLKSCYMNLRFQFCHCCDPSRQ